MEILWRSAAGRQLLVPAALRLRMSSILPCRWAVDQLDLLRLPEIGVWRKGRVLGGTTGNLNSESGRWLLGNRLHCLA
jgi:hypothetical protein